MPTVLIIEDDADIAELVRHALERDGAFRVRVEADGAAGLARALETPPDLILLDLNLPGMDGMEICRALRDHDSTRAVPLIMLTARVEESRRVAGLDAGADDYVSKPFSIKELLARVRALLRRSGAEAEVENRVVAGRLEIDLGTRRVRDAGVEVRLTRKEFDLLTKLVRGKGRVLSREQLLDSVWGYEHQVTTRTVDVHVRQLRKKIGEPTAERIETVVGVGYRFRTGRS
jgi:DNA-binding response OmpR family regulator